MTYTDVGIGHPNTDAFVHKFFNTAAFVPQTQMIPGSYGNAGRNFINPPALFNTDLTLTREFPIRERLKMQLRGEFFNLLNEKHFLIIPANTTVGSGKLRPNHQRESRPSDPGRREVDVVGWCRKSSERSLAGEIVHEGGAILPGRERRRRGFTTANTVLTKG